jgi:hypothetical protein
VVVSVSTMTHRPGGDVGKHDDSFPDGDVGKHDDSFPGGGVGKHDDSSPWW